MAALTAYIYIKRYVQKDEAAFIGGIMYAFSGFQMFSMIYNSFHDVTALFPLLLLSFDMLVTENRKCFFAVMTGIMALTNYFFFFGQVVFIIIYYIIRCLKKDFIFTMKNFLNIALEAVIGVMISSVLLIPTFYIISSGDRISNVLGGTDLIAYSDNTIIPKIIQSLFIMPDLPSHSQLFQSENNANNWASVSLYLPLFTITGLSVYIKNNRKSWMTCLFAICMVIACIPVFNSTFYMFNSSYYARWFYMPILFMCIASVECIDNDRDIMYGMKIQGAALAILGMISLLPKEVIKDQNNMEYFLKENVSMETELKFFKMSDIPIVFWQTIGFGVIFLLVLYVYNVKRSEDANILKKISAVMIGMIVITYSIYINNTVNELEFKDYNETALDYIPDVDTQDFYRISDINASATNYSMFWGMSSSGSFHSVVPNSCENFYFGVQGKKRMMRSSYSEKDYPVYGLLSVKYIFNRSTGDDLNVQVYPADLKGFKLYDKQGYYYIYENEHFVPIGNMYTYCIRDKKLNEYLDSLDLNEEKRYTYKKMLMMRALVLNDEDIEKYSSYITEIPDEMMDSLDEETYFSDCDDRADSSCSVFEYDEKGFYAEITAGNSGLVYFSVPSVRGWSAKVNDKDIDIISAHYGLSAVPVEQGENKIEFSYKTPGLKEGSIITLAGLFLLLVYFAVCKKISVQNAEK